MNFKPMLAEKYKAPLRGKYLIEPKFDGVRGLFDGNTLWGRAGRAITNPPEMLACLKQNFAGCVLDGEVCGSTWGETASVTRTEHAVSNSQVIFWVFDYLGKGSRTLCGHTLEARKLALLDLWFEREVMLPVRIVHHIPLDGIDPLEIARQYCREGFEGAMLKELHSPYIPGARTKYWQKIKFDSEADALIIGATAGEGRLEGTLGALAVEDANGKQFRVGGGFSDTERRDIWKMFQQGELLGRTVSITYQADASGITGRFPRYVRLRTDCDQ